MMNKDYSQHYSEALKYSYKESDNFLPRKARHALEHGQDHHAYDQPIEDLPHLVHADYLDDHSKHTTAAFIRKATEDKTLEHYISLSREQKTPQLYTSKLLDRNPDFPKLKRVSVIHSGPVGIDSRWLPHHDQHIFHYYQDLHEDQAEALHSALIDELGHYE